MYHSPPRVSIITKNILITVIRFACYYLLLAFNSTLMTDSWYLCAIQIWWNLNEHQYCLTSTKSVIFLIDRNCSWFQSLAFDNKLESLKLVSATFNKISIFSSNDRPSKTMKNVFYFISKAVFVLEIFKFL